jgi:hypothetical protein
VTGRIYHAEQSYYTQSGQVRGEWQGKLAQEWSLAGEVSAEQFTRLAQGHHPVTGEQLVRYQQPREYTNDAGETVRSGAPRGMGCDIQRAQKRFAHRALSSKKQFDSNVTLLSITTLYAERLGEPVRAGSKERTICHGSSTHLSENRIYTRLLSCLS